MSDGYESFANVRRNSRMVIWSAFALAIILVINAFFSLYLLRKNSVQDHSDQLSNLTVILAEHTAQTMFSANTALETIVDAVKNAKVDNETAYKEFARKKAQFDLLEGKTKANTIIDVATFVAEDGSVLNYSRSFPPPDINLAERDYFKYLSTHDDVTTFYSVPVRNKGNGKWVFYLARRINGKGNEFLGVALVGVSVEVFSSLYERIAANLGEGSAVTLYRNDKTLLTRWPLVQEMIGKVNTNTFIDDSLASANVRGGVIFGSGAGFSRGNVDPLERMLSYRKVDGYPFIVGAVVPESIYLANWQKNAFGIFLATALSLVVLFVGTYVLLTTYRRNAEHHYKAHHDVLTRLPNRSLFSDRLQTSLAICKRKQEKLALLFVDLDNLKTINDEYSHSIGDALLIEVASRMKACVRETDTVARLGGDEFIILLPGVGGAEDAFKIAEKIKQAIIQPVVTHGATITTSASIGIAIYPDHGQDGFALMNNADRAMYEVKSAGRNSIRIFDDRFINTSGN